MLGPDGTPLVRRFSRASVRVRSAVSSMGSLSSSPDRATSVLRRSRTHCSVVKCSARPCNPSANEPDDAAMQDPRFLRKAMRATLEQQDACFEFLVQPRTTTSMSVERSMIEWDENESPFQKVATLTIPKQAFDLPAQDEFCANLSFSPWHARGIAEF